MTEEKALMNIKNGMLGGRPKGSIEETTFYKKEIKRVITEKVYKAVGKMTDAQILEAIAGSTMAFTALMDRAIDKPVQGIEHSGVDGNPIVFLPMALIEKHGLTQVDKPVDVTKDIQKIDNVVKSQLSEPQKDTQS